MYSKYIQTSTSPIQLGYIKVKFQQLLQPLLPLLTVPLMRASWMASKSSTGHQHSAMRHRAVTSRLNLFIVWKMDLIFTTFCFQVSIWPAIVSSWVILWSCVWRNTWNRKTCVDEELNTHVQWTSVTQNTQHSTSTPGSVGCLYKEVEDDVMVTARTWVLVSSHIAPRNKHKTLWTRGSPSVTQPTNEYIRQCLTLCRSSILPLTAISISRLLAEVGGHSYRVARNLQMPDI